MASNGRRGKKRRKVDPDKLGRATKGRAEYVLMCIRDQPWLDGKWSKLIKLVQDRYPCVDSTAGKAVALAYDLLEDERAKRMPHLVGYLDRVHRGTIELGQRARDGRIITPAAAELRKLHGIGEPDRVQLSGSVDNNLTADAALLLGALKLTNAQRQAEIEKLESELGDEPTGTGPRAPDAPAGVGPDQMEETEDGKSENDYSDDDE